MRTDVLDSLRDGSQAAGQGRSQYKLQSMLVILEMALALLLLVASGLLLRSFRKMLETDPGFQSQHVLAASLSLPRHDYPTQQKVDEFYAELQRKIEILPGVRTRRLLFQHSNRRPKGWTHDYAGRPCAVHRRGLPHCVNLSPAGELSPGAPYSADPWSLL